jgi:hypothetical protein
VWFDVGGRDDQLEKRNQQAVLRESVAPKEWGDPDIRQ